MSDSEETEALEIVEHNREDSDAELDYRRNYTRELVTAEAIAEDRIRLDCLGVPTQYHETLINYVHHGLRPGQFFEAVLSNNLLGCFQNGDADAVKALRSVIAYLYNYVPSNRWGSPSNVQRWLAARVAS